jgi:crossover junction endodeoxyribonuclease RuvC
LKYYDASDALAVAVCHHFNANGVSTSKTTKKKTAAKSANSWDTFIKKNPERIKQK